MAKCTVSASIIQLDAVTIEQLAGPGYLDSQSVAEQLGVKVGTVHDYRTSGRLPHPDAYLFDCPLWKQETITAYIASLPPRANVHRVQRMAS